MAGLTLRLTGCASMASSGWGFGGAASGSFSSKLGSRACLMIHEVSQIISAAMTTAAAR